MKARRAKVVYPYVPQYDDELKLEVDDVIEILDEIEDGWWKGVNTKGITGAFPSNFVVEVNSDSPQINKKDVSDKSGSDSLDGNKSSLNRDDKLEKKPKPIGKIFGDIFGRGKEPKLSPIGNNKKVVHKNPPPPTPTVEAEASPKLAPKPVREQAKVLFAYEAQNDDELTIKEGDIITIVSKEIEDIGWWKGELNGRIALLPDNFVELIKTEEIKSTKQEPQPTTVPFSIKLDVVPQANGSKHDKEIESNGKSNVINNGSENHFTSMDGTSNKLTHLTQSRPKGPSSRLNESKENKDVVSVKVKSGRGQEIKFEKEGTNQRTHTLITQTIRTVVENKLEEVMTSLKPTIETVVDKWLERQQIDAKDKERDDCKLDERFKGIEAKIIGLEKDQQNLINKISFISKEINELTQEFNKIREQFNKNSEGGPLPKHDMTLDELRKYNGKGSDKRICIGILGKVYDCTKGHILYGPEGPYGTLAGHDATRALATFDVGSIKEEWDDVSDLTPNQMASANKVMEQFSERYDYVGRLVRDVNEKNDSKKKTKKKKSSTKS